jgi:ERCC4 domain
MAKWVDSAGEAGSTNEFVVARNPDAASRLPFLLRLPLGGGMWLKARESWPRASRVYCHPCPSPLDLASLDIVERVPVLACTRRGPAIDLVLERGVNRQAQFIFTTSHGRDVILWQTPRVTALARPGVRVPFRPAQALERIIIDTRERYGYTFGSCDVVVNRAALRHGDYLAIAREAPVAIVERKRDDDFVHGLIDGKLAFALAELSGLPSPAVVVETSYSRLLRSKRVSGAFLAEVLARLQVRYPNVPIVFVENRALGERWTYAFFRAAAAERDQAPLPLSTLLLPPEAPGPPAIAATRRRSRRSVDRPNP